MKKTAFLFPGQGSQFVGMGLDLYQKYEFVKQCFDMAEDITGIDISDICFNGPMEKLTATVNLQPAITVINLACMSVLAKEGIKPDISAGHSLGEYSALCAAGIISYEDAVKLVFKRGQLMYREAEKNEGAMYAIIGLSIDKVQEIVDNTEGLVSVANHNAEKQIVITGSPEPVKAAAVSAAESRAKAVPLKVSGAWHSSLMKGAEDEFREFLNTITFNTPETAVIHNVNADMIQSPEAIRDIMAQQLCSPVKWYDSVVKLMNESVEIFVEVGPGKVLTGLLKKILPKDYPCSIYNVGDVKSIESFLEEIK